MSPFSGRSLGRPSRYIPLAVACLFLWALPASAQTSSHSPAGSQISVSPAYTLTVPLPQIQTLNGANSIIVVCDPNAHVRLYMLAGGGELATTAAVPDASC